MTHDELLAKIDWIGKTKNAESGTATPLSVAVLASLNALRVVVKLHKPRIITNIHSGKKYFFCSHCLEEQGDYMSPKEVSYPCPTIQAIQEQLK